MLALTWIFVTCEKVVQNVTYFCLVYLQMSFAVYHQHLYSTSGLPENEKILNY
jgi:hypothetical protein